MPLVYRDADTAGEGRLRAATIAVRAGRPRGDGEPLNQPPVPASAFGSGAGSGYGRRSNPTWEAFEAALGALDGGTAVCFGSGMAAASAALDELATGARVLVARDAYVEVRQLLAERRERGGLRLREVDAHDTRTVVEGLEGCDLLWLDALGNPCLDVPELDAILAAARRAGALAVVDATLATPLAVRPLALGADLVLHSAGKQIGGHSDLVLGALVARDPRLAERLADRRMRAGSVPGTLETWLALRGLRTLPLRVERGAQTAALLAPRIAAHPAVRSIRYPGLPSDPSHGLASRLMSVPGSVIAFELADAEAADAVCATVEVICHASSLGGVETLVERQGRWHADPAVASGLLRLSVGCEDPEDLWADLRRALDGVFAARAPAPTLRTARR